MPRNAPIELRTSTLSISAVRRMVYAVIVIALLWGLVAWAVTLP